MVQEQITEAIVKLTSIEKPSEENIITESSVSSSQEKSGLKVPKSNHFQETSLLFKHSKNPLKLV